VATSLIPAEFTKSLPPPVQIVLLVLILNSQRGRSLRPRRIARHLTTSTKLLNSQRTRSLRPRRIAMHLTTSKKLLEQCRMT